MKEKKVLSSKIFIVLSVISVIVILIYTAFLYGNGSGMFDGLALLLPFIFIPIALGIIWGIYFIIYITIILSRKRYGYLFILLFIAFLSCTLFWLRYSNLFIEKTKNIHNVVDSPFKKSYLIYNDELYYANTVYSRFLYDILVERLMHINLDGSGNYKLCDNFSVKGDELALYFIKNNELYYSNKYESNEVKEIYNKKINLSTCEVTDLIDDYRYIRNTATDTYVYMYKEDFSGNVDFIKYDYIHNKILDQRKLMDYFNADKIVIDYDNFNVYESRKNILYVNGYPVYRGDKELNILLLAGRYLFFYDDDFIYKYDIVSNMIINTINNSYDKINRIYSDTNDNYFQASKQIYKYDEKLDNFVSILSLNSDYYTYEKVFHFQNKLLFDTENQVITVVHLSDYSKKVYGNVYYYNDRYIVRATSGSVKVEKIY